MLQTNSHSPRGFTLVEALVATGVLVTALAGIAQLFALCVRTSREAGAQGVALRAAQRKLETLRAAPFTYDAAGVPITHAELEPSPPLTLFEDREGYVDRLDDEGEVVDRSESGASFTRRWSVSALDDRDPAALVIEVCVFTGPARRAAPAAAEVCLSTIRSRQP